MKYKKSRYRYKFWYDPSGSMTVTVYAINIQEGIEKARQTLDKRYEKANKEPPVGWTLTLNPRGSDV